MSERARPPRIPRDEDSVDIVGQPTARSRALRERIVDGGGEVKEDKDSVDFEGAFNALKALGFDRLGLDKFRGGIVRWPDGLSNFILVKFHVQILPGTFPVGVLPDEEVGRSQLMAQIDFEIKDLSDNTQSIIITNSGDAFETGSFDGSRATSVEKILPLQRNDEHGNAVITGFAVLEQDYQFWYATNLDKNGKLVWRIDVNHSVFMEQGKGIRLVRPMHTCGHGHTREHKDYHHNTYLLTWKTNNIGQGLYVLNMETSNKQFFSQPEGLMSAQQQYADEEILEWADKHGLTV